MIDTLTDLLLDPCYRKRKTTIDEICQVRPVKTLDSTPFLDYKDRLRVTITSKSKKEKFMVTSSIFEEDEKEFDSGSSI